MSDKPLDLSLKPKEDKTKDYRKDKSKIVDNKEESAKIEDFTKTWLQVKSFERSKFFIL